MKLAHKLFKHFTRRQAAPATARAVAPAPLLLALEPRVVYDGSVAAVAAVHHADPAPGLAHYGAQRTSTASTAQALGEGDAPSSRAAGHRWSDAHVGAATVGTPQAVTQVVFIDPNVADYRELISGLPTGTRYVVLNDHSDGLAQIAQYLAAHPGVESVYLISHGSEGQVQAGSTVLDLGDISTYSGELAQIGAAMKPGGDFLIYGCDVAEGSDGQALVQEIASLTGLNVAASTHPVGAASLGGSWTLDYDVGTVDAPAVLSASAEQGYDHLLSQTVEEYNDGTADTMLYNDNLEHNDTPVYVSTLSLDGITYTTNTSSYIDIDTDTTLQELPSEAGDNPQDQALLINEGGPLSGPSQGYTNVTSVTISMTDGRAFSMSSFDLDAYLLGNPGSITVTGMNGSTQTGQVTLSSDGTYYVTQTVSLGSGFSNVTSITIAGGDMEPNLGHLVYSEAAPPALTTTGGTTAYEAGASAVTVAGGVALSDSGASTQQTATVQISGGLHSGDTLSFANTSSTEFGDITASYVGATGTLTLQSDGASSNAQWQAALNAITFSSTSGATGTRTISLTTNDGTSSNTATETVNVTAGPVVTTTGGTTSYASGGLGTPVDSGVTVTDGSKTTETSATVSITSGFQSGDVLNFTNESGITGVYNSATGTLTLSGTATTAEWTAALDSVEFSSMSSSDGDRTVSFTVSDGSVTSATATKTVDVTAPLQITTDSGSASFVAGDNTASAPVTIDSGLSLTDSSTGALQTATVAITGNFHSGEDVLAFTNNGTTMGNISGAYDAATGVLTLTSASGTATTTQWEAALQAVAYTDTAVTPNTATRTISFTATDDNSNTSNTATRTVTVADTDQTPIVTTTGGTTDYAGGAGAVTIDGNVRVTDLDNTTQASGTVSITSGFHSGDVLSFSNTGSIQYGNIQASYDPTTGVLTLTSPGATASDAQWAEALSAVTFSSTSTSYGNRTISFTTNDGEENSAVATDTVDMLGPPQITTDSGSAAFVAGDNTTSTPVAVDPGLTVTDGSAPTLATVTVAITGNFQSGQDVLGFTNTNSATFGNIEVASYNSTTGVLTLTSAGESATLTQWGAALKAVTYTDTAITPNDATRTISFTAVDSGGTTSNTGTRTVTVTDTDQTPIVTTTAGTTSYVGGTSAVPVNGGVTVTDLDNTTQASGSVSITSGFYSGDTLSFSNTSSSQFGNIQASYNSATGVLTLTSEGATSTDAQWASAFNAVTFSASVSATPGDRTISFVVNDGEENSAAATKTVDVLGPPVVTTDAGSASFVAGDNTTSTPVAIDSGLTLTDPGSGALQSATVSITGNFHSGEDSLAFTNNGTTMGNISGVYDAATGVLTLTSVDGTATTTQWEAALEAVTYTDSAVTPNTATRTISFTVTDDNNNTSNTATRTVTVADTDQTPIVTTTAGTTTYVGGTAAVPVDGGVGVSDRGDTTQASGSVSVTSGFASGDTLSFSNTSSSQFGNIQASYNSTTGVLTLTSSDATASDAQWANAFDAVTFSSTSTSYGNRTVSFIVNDGEENSAAATKTVDVLGPPVVTTDAGSASFVAGDNVTSPPVTVDPTLALTDPGSGALQSATVSITGNFHSGEDVLAFTNTNSTTFGNIEVSSYNTATGVLTLTSSDGTATTTQWQAALEAVTYTDTAITPNTATRTISFTVTDDNLVTSNTATRTVTVADTDQTPIVTTTAGTTTYVGGTAGIAVDGGVGVSDRGDTTQASGTVSITGGYESGDTLSFTNTSSTQYGNIQASYNSTTGVLTLTSSDATASDAQWANAFDAVTFSASTSVTPGNRTISFVVNDGTENSAAATKTVDVLGPPIVTTDPGSAAFVAGDNVTSTPVAVDSDLMLTDRSSGELQSATVSITGNFHSGEDVLAFTNTNSATFGDISGSYNAATGVLTLSSAGGAASFAQWQAALQAVTYTDTAITPNDATRTISFTVTDANGNGSAAATRTVTVADTDQTPIVTTDSGSTAFVAGDNVTSAPVTVDSRLTLTDRDNGELTSATVSITGNFQSGEDVLAFANNGATMGNIAGVYDSATGVLTLTSAHGTATTAQWQAALEAVTYTDTATTPNDATRTISFTVTDAAGNSSAAATRTVTVADTDQTPIVTTDSGSAAFVAGDNVTSAPVAVDSGLTLTDRDNGELTSATVSITGNFQSGEDVLAFANTNSTTFGDISGSYNSATGVLTLTSAHGTATTAQWQAALAAVTYTDTAITPNDATRTISFTVTDAAGNGSAAATRTVTVADTDQTPIVSGGNNTVTYAGTGNGAEPTVLDPGVTLTDRGGASLASAQVWVSGNFVQGQDLLAFTGSAATGNIAGSYNATTGVLTLTSNGSTATLAQWAAALDAVTFAEIGQISNGSRTVSFTVSDGVKSSAPVSVDVAVVVVTDRPAATTPTTTTSTDSSTVVHDVSGGVVVNEPQVLAEFDPAPKVGALPEVLTITFSGPGSVRPDALLDFTSVAPIPPAPASDGPALIAWPVAPTVDLVSVGVVPSQPFSMTLSSVLPTTGSASVVSVRLADGQALPGWLHYDAASGALQGALPPGAHDVRIVIDERAADGRMTQHELVLAPRHADAPRHHAQTAQPHRGHALKPVAANAVTPLAARGSAGQAPLPAGKPSLAQQFAHAQAALHVARPAVAAAVPAPVRRA